MSKNMQPLSMLPVQPGEDLFGTDSGYEDPRSAELRIAQTVAHIAARARPVAYEMRVSEATADQGHAPYDDTVITALPLSERDPEADPFADYKKQNLLFEMPGKDGQTHRWNQRESAEEIAKAQAELPEAQHLALPDVYSRGGQAARESYAQAVARARQNSNH
jgi:hypothetical protein